MTNPASALTPESLDRMSPGGGITMTFDYQPGDAPQVGRPRLGAGNVGFVYLVWDDGHQEIVPIRMARRSRRAHLWTHARAYGRAMHRATKKHRRATASEHNGSS